MKEPILQILPVIDLQGGIVVRGVAGQRALYRPVESVLCETAKPGDVARAFADKCGFRRVYVADLDAISRRVPRPDAWREIASAGLELWLDAGVQTPDDLKPLLEFAGQEPRLTGVVLGLESSPDPETLRTCFEILGPEKAIFSLDLREGQPWTESPAWRSFSPEQIAAQAVQIGFLQIILLDVASVGVSKGVSVREFAAGCVRRWPEKHWLAAGGVQNEHDLQNLTEIGCFGVLIASALHAGTLQVSRNPKPETRNPSQALPLT